MMPFRAFAIGILAAAATATTSFPASTNDYDVLPPAIYADRLGVQPNAPALLHAITEAVDLTTARKPPADAAAWNARRPTVETAFRKALGLDPLPPRSPLGARITATQERGGIVVENIVFESRPGFPVTANLYRPEHPPSPRLPAVLSPVGHFLSAGKTATDVQARCLGLAHRGCVVLTYDPIGQGERMRTGNVHHDAGYTLLPLGETIAGWMVWDSMRALDYLESRDDVDATRIGMTGNSGGGLNTLFTAALDERVDAAVVVGFTFDFGHWLRYGGTHCACTHLPGMVRDLEWFEIAGLIAPRSLLMIQGERDLIFPIQGARRAAENTASVYAALDRPDRVRFLELPDQPHAYTRPFREPMYEWMLRELQAPSTEGLPTDAPNPPLPEKHPSLLCDPARTFRPSTPTVVDLARSTASRLPARLPHPPPPESRASFARRLSDLIATGPLPLVPMVPTLVSPPPDTGDAPERLLIPSEPGVQLPALLWRDRQSPRTSRAVVLVDGQGKDRIGRSGLVEPLLRAGYAVVAADLRGRGELLARYGDRHDINFRLAATHVLTGRSLVGRRAFDVRRLVDFVASRRDLDTRDLAIVGVGDDALPVLVAAATDARVRRVGMAEAHHGFASSMGARPPAALDAQANTWNDPQLDGHVSTGFDRIDFGNAVPAILTWADIPDLVSLIAPRPLLACAFRDLRDPSTAMLASRFRDRLRTPVANRSEYSPEAPLDAERLLAWLERSSTP
ncbi:MAG: acetylxylan esterase [Verrucomicrobiales bacterium]|nr:acetylxylan esterase [Verrucomicrobiales bacterium]